MANSKLKSEAFQFDDQLIRLADHVHTQSVNICTRENRFGHYEQVFYLSGKYRVTRADIENHQDLAALTKWLRRKAYNLAYGFAESDKASAAEQALDAPPAE